MECWRNLQMNKKVLLALPLLFAAGLACGQSHDSGSRFIRDRIVIETALGMTPRQDGVTSFMPSLKVGCEAVRRLTVYYVLDGTLSLSKHDGHRYGWSNSMGGGLGCRMFNLGGRDAATGAESDAVDLRGFITSTYGKASLKHTSYTLMLAEYYYRGRSNVGDGLCFGLGYRYVDSHTLGVKNTHNLYVSVGYRW